MIILPVIPKPKPRLTHKGRFTKTAKTYYAYCDALRWAAHQAHYMPGDVLSLSFVLPMPKSWSGKKREAMRGMPHQSRPDLSNLVKAFEDALFPEKTGGDSHIYEYRLVKKVWGDDGCILIHSLHD
jgi:Holliday junction resolvase RusA-like endonuclease